VGLYHKNLLEGKRKIEDTRELIRVRQGLCDMHYNRAEFPTARSLAEQLLHLAQRRGESICLPRTHAALSRILFAIGEFELAHGYAAQDKHTAARKTLAESYDWFSEGFDTGDLQEASTLLAQLS